MKEEQKNSGVSDEIIAICALNATLRTEGVASMAGGLTNALKLNLLGKEMLSKGIKVNQWDDELNIDVHINVKFGYKIPAVAWDIQENVKNEILNFANLTVTAVNIHVQGVEKDDEK